MFDPGDRGVLAIYWISLFNLKSLEGEVDKRCGNGTWRDVTDDHRREAWVLATLPHIFTMMSRFDRLILQPAPRGESTLAVLVDPETAIFPLAIAKAENGLQLHVTNLHERICGVDGGSSGSPPDSLPFVLSPPGWKLQCFAMVDHLWAVLEDKAASKEGLAQLLGQTMIADAQAFMDADIMRFPAGVNGPAINTWLGWSGGSTAEWQPGQGSAWSPIGPTNNGFLNDMIMGR